MTVSNTPGKSVWMGAQLKRSSDTKWQRDADVYSYYAGPVYRYAPSQCIDWGGQFDNGGVVIPNDHCG
ncbi:hypothetical protein [Actinomadura sp. WMMB 499]|uniref:hypothetical protein n=1 Tax=Actinomadura sp. WMMB 499 TaxID=1219491 RepID=UPI0034A0BB54